jgi:anthranilate synthase component 1
VSAFVKLVGDARGLPARVGRARRTLGPVLVPRRDPALTFVARGRDVEWIGGARPTGAVRSGNAGRARGAAARYRAPEQSELPPFHGGIVGWIGYDTVREIERLPDVPHDDLGLPDAVCRSPGRSRRSTTSASAAT